MDTKTDLKLFFVTTIVHEFDGYKNVHLTWYYHGERAEPRPYAELIEDYDPTDPDFDFGYAKEHINEMFSEDEANQLKAYLDANKGEHSTTVEPAHLPVSTNELGPGCVPVGGPQGFYTGLEGKLPFETWAYYDVRDCERVEATPV
jgi:hypothetical protein